ncbi:MAG: hypothetical protein PHP06_11090, partial [Clostridia bacterium]|nr:hypothetical protein [Clostridia bacterium]
MKIYAELGDESHKAWCMQYFPYVYKGTEKLVWYTPVIPFRIMVDPSGEGNYIPLATENSHTFEVFPGEPDKLYAIVPSYIEDHNWVKTGEVVYSNNSKNIKGLRLVITDKFNNPINQANQHNQHKKYNEHIGKQSIDKIEQQKPNDNNGNIDVISNINNTVHRVSVISKVKTGEKKVKSLKAISNPFL